MKVVKGLRTPKQITGRIEVHWGASEKGIVTLLHKVQGRLSEMELNKDDLIEVFGEQITVSDVSNTIVSESGQSYYQGVFVKVYLDHFAQLEIIERKQALLDELLDGIVTNEISAEDVINRIVSLNTKKLIK